MNRRKGDPRDPIDCTGTGPAVVQAENRDEEVSRSLHRLCVRGVVAMISGSRRRRITPFGCRVMSAALGLSREDGPAFSAEAG